MQAHLDALRIPASFKDYDTETSADTLSSMELFKGNAESHLTALMRDLTQDITEHARLLFHIVPFDTYEPWVDDASRSVSHKILAATGTPSVVVIREILSNYVKPAFSSTPHPSVNLQTGRRLARPIGGAAAAHDLYEQQTWKTTPGLPSVVSWCAEHVESADYEQLWHLLVPPLMTLLDDFELKYKIWGMRIAASIIERAPKTLFHRSGIDGLLDKSIVQTFFMLHDPRTPSLLEISIPTYIQLLRRTTEVDSLQRLNKLFDLLGSHIIGTIWVYAARDPDTIVATTDMVPLVVRELGISTCRFLKALVPQLLHPLTTEMKLSASLAVSSMAALETVIMTCRARMETWSEVIFTSICKGWVRWSEDDRVRTGMISLMKVLLEMCPGLRQTAVPRVNAAAGSVFVGLLDVDCN